MPIEFACESCGAQHSVPDDKAGAKGRCGCGAVMQVPTVAPAQAAEAPPPEPSAVSDAPPEPQPASQESAQRPATPRRAKRALGLAAGLVLLCVLVGAVGLAWHRLRRGPAAPAASRVADRGPRGGEAEPPASPAADRGLHGPVEEPPAKQAADDDLAWVLELADFPDLASGKLPLRLRTGIAYAGFPQEWYNAKALAELHCMSGRHESVSAAVARQSKAASHLAALPQGWYDRHVRLKIAVANAYFQAFTQQEHLQRMQAEAAKPQSYWTALYERAAGWVDADSRQTEAQRLAQLDEALAVSAAQLQQAVRGYHAD